MATTSECGRLCFLKRLLKRRRRSNDRYSTHASLARLERAVAPKLCYSRPAPPGVGGGRFGDEVGSDNYWVPIHASHNEARGSR